MATLSSSRFYDLVERFFTLRRNSNHAVFDILKVEYPAVRRLAENEIPSSELIDEAWLQRAELCGHDAVVRFLTECGFRKQNSMLVLFVDERCGLIAHDQIDSGADFSVAQVVARILDTASSHHARGIILATHEFDRTLSNDRRQKLTMDLYHKGEAIGVTLLDHFVLTDGIWKRMFVIRKGRRP